MIILPPMQAYRLAFTPTQLFQVFIAAASPSEAYELHDNDPA